MGKRESAKRQRWAGGAAGSAFGMQMFWPWRKLERRRGRPVCRSAFMRFSTDASRNIVAIRACDNEREVEIALASDGGGAPRRKSLRCSISTMAQHTVATQLATACGASLDIKALARGALRPPKRAARWSAFGEPFAKGGLDLMGRKCNRCTKCKRDSWPFIDEHYHRAPHGGADGGGRRRKSMSSASRSHVSEASAS